MRSAETRGLAVKEKIVSFDEALSLVLEHARRLAPMQTRRVSLEETHGRVLASPIASDRDQPPFDRSTRDGYAVRAAELNSRAWLRVIGQVRAGEQWDAAIGEGETVETMTGAPVTSETDAVVMLEHVERAEDKIRVTEGRILAAGENIVPRGSEARRGEIVLATGTEMTPAAIALAAGCGAAMVMVYERPRVSVLATGDELVDVTQTPGPAQIRNSNSYGLAALVEEAGGVARRWPVAPDEHDELYRAIVQARDADLLLLSGGVSMGEYDLVEQVLEEMGAEFVFTGVRMQPGKPLVFGWLPERDRMPALPFFGLPGNPVSTQVTSACFVVPLLRAMRGATASVPRFVMARLDEDLGGKPGLTRALPAWIEHERHEPAVRLVAWQGSGDMTANARANCYAILPEGVAQFRAGDLIRVLLK